MTPLIWGFCSSRAFTDGIFLSVYSYVVVVAVMHGNYRITIASKLTVSKMSSTSIAGFLLWYRCINSLEAMLLPFNNSSRTEPRVYRGYTCSTKDFPFMVQVLKLRAWKWYITCGGTLVSSYWVLTAAHCFDNPKNVHAIRASVDNPFTYPIFMFVDAIFLHEYFDGRLLTNDIALMKLIHPLKGHKYVNYVELPKFTIDHVESQCATGLIIGWGRNEANLTKPLQCAKLPVLNYQNCNIVYRKNYGYSYYINSRQICTLSQRGVDACKGDSGGPLMCGSVQIGIISWGIGCAVPTAPTVYTSVGAYLDFINRIVESNSSGSYIAFCVSALVLQLIII